MNARIIIALLLAAAGLNSCAAAEKTIAVPSRAMNREFKTRIILPQTYSGSGKNYSVLYLLHGYGGDHTSWTRLVSLEELSSRYHLIFVCVNGDRNSWYIDSPVEENSLFSQYIACEVVSYIDSTYRTHAIKKGRALIGSSMGGHGALTILARYPDIFAGAASISGIVDLTDFPDEWELDRVLGPWKQNKERWHRFSFAGMIDSLHNTKCMIILDCGTGDPAVDGNRKAHQKLLSLGIRHHYCERPGKHTPRYVADAFEHHVITLGRKLLSAR
ncbi:MAG: alpha/beta fold hydrolase [Chitinivibrionales bacterium]|nr:alpha/beta fold hydrolase [Chitinivibrionales bacterium]